MKELTEIVMVLDQSGSMNSIANDIVGGFATFIEEQKKLPGEAKVSVIYFSDLVTESFVGKPLNEVSELTGYRPQGSTALYDALGTSINNLGNRLSMMNEADRPNKVIFVIITDGQENASREFTKDQIKDMIEHQSSKYSWEFVYLGANQDSFAEGGSIGIRGNSTFNFCATSAGTRDMSVAYSSAVSSYRTK